MKTDLEIAYDADVKPIKEIAAKIGISEDDLVPYGKYIAKVPLPVLEKLKDKPNGKLVLVTAITEPSVLSFGRLLIRFTRNTRKSSASWERFCAESSLLVKISGFSLSRT